MARVTIARTALTAAGLNLTDATFTTLATGANNGIEVVHRIGDVLILKNSTAGPAVFTIKVAQPTAYASLGLVVPDETFTVAAGKTVLVPLSPVFKQTDGDLYVDCDVAGQVIELAVSG